ncbi:Rha family transcriptional regulator, partial [Ideonella sp.]|uniref:Rha family transcriptional regulator n=1 Tax=Ideonella sp. TaxID=1929293 RepID=UPI003BB4C047
MANVGIRNLSKPDIAREGNELVTDSRAVAIAFGKRHADVLRAIERRLCSVRGRIATHAQRNFALCSYVDTSGGRSRPMYRMTAKGLSELAMGFSGDEAGNPALETSAVSALSGDSGDRQRKSALTISRLTFE